jgi:carbon storage regulator
MLVMKRRQGESILIGDDIEIQLAQIGRTKVKIAIKAPRNIRVIAKEVERVQHENRAAASSDPRADLTSIISQLRQTHGQERDSEVVCRPSRDV